MSKIKFKNVVLVGVGLIGGSLSRDLLREKVTKKIVGFDTDRKNLNYAVKNKIVTVAGRDLEKEFSQSDLIILATPVVTLEKQVKELASLIPSKTLVIDVGSTKTNILKLADRYFPKGNFVGCHPMAGSEKSGAKASVVGLFDGAPCLIVRGKKTKTVFSKRARSLWQSVGATTLDLDVKNHDRYLAACSHLPHVLSYALMHAVGKRISPSELKKIAGKSFKSYTRIAGSDARMWTDIFLVNQKHTLAKMKYFERELKQLERLIQKGDSNALFRYLESTADLWRHI